MLNKDLNSWREDVLLFFRTAPLKLAIDVQEEALGIVESRRVTERPPEDKEGKQC